MKKITTVIFLTLLFTVNGAHAQTNERDILMSIDELRDSIIKADIRLNHELFKIVLEQSEVTKRLPIMIFSFNQKVTGIDAELDRMITEANKLDKIIMNSRDSILSKSRSSSIVNYAVLDSLSRNPAIRELEKKRTDLLDKANLLRVKFYVEDRMKNGRYIDLPVNTYEKERYMENPILKKINAQIELYEKMIKAKELKLLSQ